MTAVLVAVDAPSPGVIREVRAGRLAAGDAAEPEVTAFIDRLARALRAHRAALVLYPSWRPEPTERLVRMARGVLRTDRIAAVPLDLPPLALSLIADQLAYMSRHVGPGVLAGLAGRLAEEVIAGAWVGSVARLEHVETGLRAHLSSYLPGSAFMVLAGSRAGVHRITDSEPVAQLGPRPVDPVVVLASPGEGDASWVHGVFKPTVAAAVVTSVPTQPLSPLFWGTRKYVEFVAFSGHPGALSRAARAVRGRPCRWCGEATALPVCAFCAMVQPTPPKRVPPRKGPAPVARAAGGVPASGALGRVPGRAGNVPAPPAPAVGGPVPGTARQAPVPRPSGTAPAASGTAPGAPGDMPRPRGAAPVPRSQGRPGPPTVAWPHSVRPA